MGVFLLELVLLLFRLDVLGEQFEHMHVVSWLDLSLVLVNEEFVKIDYVIRVRAHH